MLEYDVVQPLMGACSAAGGAGAATGGGGGGAPATTGGGAAVSEGLATAGGFAAVFAFSGFSLAGGLTVELSAGLPELATAGTFGVAGAGIGSEVVVL